MSNKIINVLAVGRGEVPAFNVYQPEAAQLAGLHNSGAACVTVITNADSVCVPYFEKHGIHIITNAMNRKLSMDTIRCVRDELKHGDYDIMYMINNTAISNGSFAAIGLPVKVVAYRGQTDNTPRFSPTSYLSILHPRVDMVICVAQAVENYVRAQQWGSKNKAATVYKGHDLDWYQGPPVDLTFLNLPDDAIVVSLVADLRRRKGLHVLMAATHYFTVPNIYILIVGGNPDDEQVQQMVATAATPDQVRPLGYRTDAPEISAASAFVVLPTTKREGLSRAILEAMAYSKPAVVSDTGGNAELVADGKTGFVVPPRDARALGEAISKLAADKDLRETMGAAARRRLVEKFSAQQGVTELLQIFRQLLSTDSR